MLLQYGSLVIIAIVAGYGSYFNFRRIEPSAENARAAASTALSLMAGASFGIVAAQAFTWGLWAAIGISLLFSGVVGMLSGVQFRLYPLGRAVLAGWLGAMLGSVLGKALFRNDKVILITVVLFVIFVYLLQRLIERTAGKQRGAERKSKKSGPKRQPMGVVILAILFIATAGIAWFAKDAVESAQIGQPQTQTAAYDDQNDLQTATIEVTSAGISPRTTEFKSGGMIKANFRVSVHNVTGYTLQSKDLNVDAALKEGDNVFLINDPKPGTYTFTIASTGKNCEFIVK